MKKYLLSLLALFCFSAFSFGATEYTKVTMAYTGTETTNMADGNNAAIVGLTATEWSVIADKGANSNMPGLNKAGDMRLYWSASGGNTITVSSLTGARIEYIEATFTGDSYSNVSVTVNDKAVSGTDGHFNIGASSFVLGNANTANTQVRISKIDIYYSGGQAATVAAPVITPASGTFLGGAVRNVTMTCETEGAEIRYRISHKLTDGMTEMQEDYSIYTEPFEILAQGRVSSTVTAWAVIPATADADEQSSAEVKVTYTYPVVYTSIYEANSTATPTSTIVALDAKEWLVTYVDGGYTYLTDGRAGLLLYGSDLGLEQGQKVSGIISGGLKTYNGLPEVEKPDVSNLEIVSEDNEVAPIVVAASALAADKMKWVNMFVTIEKAIPEESISVAEGEQAKSYNFTSEEASFIVRNQFKQAIDVVAEKKYSVSGFYAIFNDNGQIYNTQIEEFLDPADIMGDVTQYYISNPSFELADAETPLAAELKVSNGPATIFGWVMAGVGNQYNNTEIRQSNSTSTTSQFGTSDPSDGNYSLFFRQGWNNQGNIITLTAASSSELPAGNYILSVDYKQHYAHDGNSNQNTKVGIACMSQSQSLAEAVSEPAAGVSGGNGDPTYFNDAEWSTLEAPLTLSENMSVDFVITLYSSGQRRSDFFVDNFRLTRVSEEEVARAELKNLLPEAAVFLDQPAGNIFQPSQDVKDALDEAYSQAQQVYDNEEATAEAIRNQTNNLLAAIKAFVSAEPIQPDPAKQYSIQLKNTDFFMSLSDVTKLSAEPQGFYFEQTDLGYAITDGNGNYVAQAGANAWNMANSTSSYDWYIEALPDGSYQIAQAGNHNNSVGVDNVSDGSSCYANKNISQLGDRAKWNITEMSTVTVLPNIAALNEKLSSFDDVSGDYILQLTNAKVLYSCSVTDEDHGVTMEYVILEDESGRVLSNITGISALQAGMTVNGQLPISIVSTYGSEAVANDNTAAGIESLEKVEGTVEPLVITEENALDWSEDPYLRYVEFQNAPASVDGESGDMSFTPSEIAAPMSILDMFRTGITLVDGESVNIRGFLYNYLGMMDIFLPVSCEAVANALELSLDVEREVGKGYDPTLFEPDLDAIKSYLGVEDVTSIQSYVVNADDTEVEATFGGGTPDGWCDAEGTLVGWGDQCKICVKFNLADGDYSICDLNGADVVDATYAVKYAFTANNKKVYYTINVKFVAAQAIDLEISNNVVKAEVSYGLDEPQYTEKSVVLTDDQVASICQELGLESLESASVYAYNPSTSELISNYVSFDGWRAANGDFAMHTGNSEVPACVKYTDGKTYLTYNIAGLEAQTIKTYWAIANETKAVLVEISFIYGDGEAPAEGETFEYTFDETVALQGETVYETSDVPATVTITPNGDAAVNVSFSGVVLYLPNGNPLPMKDFTLENVSVSGSQDASQSYSYEGEQTQFSLQSGMTMSYAPSLTGTRSSGETPELTLVMANPQGMVYTLHFAAPADEPQPTEGTSFDGVIKQTLSHPATGVQGESTDAQTVTVTNNGDGTASITYSGFTIPTLGTEFNEFTIEGVEVTENEDGSLSYATPEGGVSVVVPRGSGTVTYNATLEGTQANANTAPVLKLVIGSSSIDTVWFAADEEALEEAIETAIRGLNALGTCGDVFDLSGRKVSKLHRGGIYVVNGKKVSVK